MQKLNYLNLACGSKTHKDWINVDIASKDSSVINCNLLDGINFSDNFFDAIYHSQFIEHIPKDMALGFMKECYRVLKPGGIIRVVTPDLENITRSYLKCLEKCVIDPGEINTANYDWLMLELYDQTVRNTSGGEMGKILAKENLINEQFIIERTGLSGRSIRNSFSREKKPQFYSGSKRNFNQVIEAIRRKLYRSYVELVMPKKEKELLESAKFRETGEIHYWMYDRFSLSRLLQLADFKRVSIKTPYDSDIPNWNTYELDVKDEQVIDPSSLFMEATK